MNRPTFHGIRPTSRCRGSGIARIFNTCHQGDATAPELKFDAGGVWMTFGFDEGYLKAVASSRAPRVTGQVTPPVTPPVDDSYTAPVAQLVRLIAKAGELGNADIRRLLGLKDRTHLRERYVAPSVAGGWIEPTIPDKPNSRLQRYRLTPAGQAKVQALDPTKS